MLSPRYLDGLSDEITEIYSQLETDILQDMARRIARLGKVTDATKWQAQMLAEAGGLKKDIGRILAKYDKAIIAQIQKTVTDALKKNTANDNRIFKAYTGRTVSEPNAQVMLSTIQKCHSDLSRLTLTTAATSERQFVAQANRAYMMTQSGAFDYDTAMKSAADELSEQGLKVVQYETQYIGKDGKPHAVTRTIESAVRMNILTSINQTAANMTLSNAEELGVGRFEVSAHIGARPEHEAWQGKIYTKEELYSKCGLGTVTGLCGINCRHSFYPYFEGMEHYSTKDLDEMADEKVTYNGKEMTRYEGEQKLRGIERNIRAYKREALTQEAAGADNTKARRKLGEWQAAARDFTKQTGIARDSAREYVGTSGKQPTGLKPLTKPPAETPTPSATPATKPTDFKFSYGNADTVEKAKQELSNFANKPFIPKDTDIASVNAVTKQFEYLNTKYPVTKLETITFSGRLSNRTGASANYCTLTINKNIKAFGQSVLQPSEWKERMTKAIDELGKRKTQFEALINNSTEQREKAFYKARLRETDKQLKQFTDYAKYTRGNVCYKGREIESTVAHEFGHIIADQRTGQINGHRANSAFERIDGNALYEKIKMIDNVYRQAKANGDIYKISKYAASNSHEFFAETFAIYAMQEENLPKYIADMIIEVIK